MFCFRLGFLTTLLPDPVIQGFLTGASFHVALSQAKYLFGLSKHVKREPGFGELFVVSQFAYAFMKAYTLSSSFYKFMLW